MKLGNVGKLRAMVLLEGSWLLAGCIWQAEPEINCNSDMLVNCACGLSGKPSGLSGRKLHSF